MQDGGVSSSLVCKTDFLPLLPLACSSSQFSISSLFVLDSAIDLCFRRVNVHVHSKLGLLCFQELLRGLAD